MAETGQVETGNANTELVDRLAQQGEQRKAKAPARPVGVKEMTVSDFANRYRNQNPEAAADLDDAALVRKVFQDNPGLAKRYKIVSGPAPRTVTPDELAAEMQKVNPALKGEPLEIVNQLLAVDPDLQKRYKIVPNKGARLRWLYEEGQPPRIMSEDASTLQISGEKQLTPASPGYGAFGGRKPTPLGSLQEEPEDKFARSVGFGNIKDAMGPVGAIGLTMALGPEAGVLARMGTAALGGGGGEAASEIADYATDDPTAPRTSGEAFGRIFRQGASQAGLEGGAWVAGQALNRLLQGGTKLGDRFLQEMAKRQGISLTAGEATGNPFLRHMQYKIAHDPYLRHLGEEHMAALTRALNGEMADQLAQLRLAGADQPGFQLQMEEVIPRGGGVGGIRPSTKGLASVKQSYLANSLPAYEHNMESFATGLSITMRDQMIPLDTLKAEAGDLAHELRYGARGLFDKERDIVSGISTPPKMLPAGYRDQLKLNEMVQNMPPARSFPEMLELRDRLRDLSQRSSLSPEARTFAGKLEAETTHLLDEAVARVHPELTRTFNTYKELQLEGDRVFKGSALKRMLQGDAVDAARTIGGKNIAEARNFKKAIFDWPHTAQRVRGGIPNRPQATGEAQAAWNTFRDTWLRETLTDGDPLLLHKRMAEVDPRVLEEIVGSDPEGVVVVDNLKKMAQATALIDHLPLYMRERAMGLLRRTFYAPLGRAVYSPAFAKAYTNGLRGLFAEMAPKAGAVGAAGKTGTFVVNVMSPKVVTALANLNRADEIWKDMADKPSGWMDFGRPRPHKTQRDQQIDQARKDREAQRALQQ